MKHRVRDIFVSLPALIIFVTFLLVGLPALIVGVRRAEHAMYEACQIAHWDDGASCSDH